MNSADYTWVNTLNTLLEGGKEIDPRNMGTKEIMSFKTIVNMNTPILQVPQRKLSYNFMFAEAYWILAGRNDTKFITEFAPSINKFSDDGVLFFGAYGPKVIDQLSYVCETLAEDLNSRQAYINIWREKPRKTKDVPCTLGLQFLVREGKLHCQDSMRSSDVWLGWPYDIFNMTMISLAVKLILKDRYGIDVELGDIILNAGSQHIYSRNYEAAQQICDEYLELVSNHNGDGKDIFNFGPKLNISGLQTYDDLLDNLYITCRYDSDIILKSWLKNE